MVRGLALGLLAAALSQSPSRAASESSLIEIRGLFIHATQQQRDAALDAAHVDRNASVLSVGQFEAVNAALAKGGAVTFGDPRIVVQVGQASSASIVKELYCAREYEPSKKDPGKSVPVRFGMRLVGVILEAGAVLDEGGRIQLKATPTYTRFLGFVDYSNLKPADKNIPSLEELLKAPLNPGGIWQPFFATFAETRTFELEDGQTAVMSGPVKQEKITPPSGQPALQSHSRSAEIVVLITARKVVRN